MELTFNDEHRLLRNAALDFLKTEVPRERVLEIDESPEGFSPDLWSQMIRLGWTGMGIPEEFGGSGNSLVELGVLYEALGEYACPGPLLSAGVLSANVILEAGDAAQKKSILGSIAGQGQIVALCYTEPDYGWGAENVSLPATRRDGGYVLNGKKLFVPDAHIADRLLIAARTSAAAAPEQGVSLFLVDKASKGVSIRRHNGWMSDNLCEVDLSNVAVPASALVGEAGNAWGAIERARDRATAVLCTYMGGGARRVTDMAIEYSKSRVAFGTPIGTFQRVQDHVIIALNDADSIKWTAFEALWKLDERRPDAPLAVSMTKAVASVAFPRACEESHQVHAGIGSDLNFGLTQYTKRARTLQHYLGDTAFHKKRMAKLLKLDQAEAASLPTQPSTGGGR
ncbi:MAG: acyl-CoA/acyl-ACP dehydrogenase [Chloroflexi bacterium]|nr:acyl-CoA/acyl-ACP dehydrogenase [Chloroflexota bacterium]